MRIIRSYFQSFYQRKYIPTFQDVLQEEVIVPRYMFYCVSIVISLLSLSVYAGSPVWKVSKDNHHLYIGGTFHLLSNDDYPLPKAFDKAYKESSELIFETDLSALQTPQYMQKLTQMMVFSDGSTLQSAIKPATLKALTAYLESRQLPPAQFATHTPTGIALTISLIEMQAIGMKPEAGVDQFFTSLAKNDKKALGQLETPDEHIAFLSGLAEGKEDEFIMKTLNDIGELPQMMGELKAAWRDGKNLKLEELGIKQLQQEFPKIYSSLLVKRNNAWIPKIEDMMKDANTEFVLVGALHLAGKEGLVSMLKAKGYKVENLQ